MTDNSKDINDQYVEAAKKMADFIRKEYTAVPTVILVKMFEHLLVSFAHPLRMPLPEVLASIELHWKHLDKGLSNNG